MTRPSYFALMCEHMAATLATLPHDTGSAFDCAQVLTHRFLAGAPAEGQWLINPDHEQVKPTDLSRPVRFAFVSDMHDEGDRARGYWALALTTASKRDLRGAGRVPFLSPFPHLRMHLAILEPYRKSRPPTCANFLSYHHRERAWVRWAPGMRPDIDAELNTQVGLAINMQFSARYDWRVLIAATKAAPRLALAVKPDNARRLFKARELPPGRERRAALRHWVTEHYRNLQAVEPTGVRSHFRGAEAFDWSGLHCEIEPSEYDRDRVGQKPSEPPGGHHGEG